MYTLTDYIQSETWTRLIASTIQSILKILFDWDVISLGLLTATDY